MSNKFQGSQPWALSLLLQLTSLQLNIFFFSHRAILFSTVGGCGVLPGASCFELTKLLLILHATQIVKHEVHQCVGNISFSIYAHYIENIIDKYEKGQLLCITDPQLLCCTPMHLCVPTLHVLCAIPYSRNGHGYYELGQLQLSSNIIITIEQLTEDSTFKPLSVSIEILAYFL